MMRYVKFLSVLFACMASSISAQTNQAEWVFQCQLNGGANYMGVQLYGDELTYFYANANNQIELNLNANVADVDLTLALWDDPNFTEVVTFQNGDTSYAVFSEAARVRQIGGNGVLNGGMVDGGVRVETPDGTRTEILCDPGTIEPKDVFRRFVRLASLNDPSFDLYAQCMGRDITDTACVDYALRYCLIEARTLKDETRCYQDNWARLDEQLSKVYANALAVTDEQGEDAVALQTAQDLWQNSRDADCAIAAWTVYNPFDGDKGRVQCLADYTAKRLAFLDAYTIGLEFDG